MAEIKNNSKGPIVIGEVMIAPDSVADVSDETLALYDDHPVIKAHLKSRTLEVISLDHVEDDDDKENGAGQGGATEPADPPVKEPDIEQLRKDAAELGIDVNPNWNKTVLQAKIDEALNGQNQK